MLFRTVLPPSQTICNPLVSLKSRELLYENGGNSVGADLGHMTYFVKCGGFRPRFPFRQTAPGHFLHAC